MECLGYITKKRRRRSKSIPCPVLTAKAEEHVCGRQNSAGKPIHPLWQALYFVLFHSHWLDQFWVEVGATGAGWTLPAFGEDPARQAGTHEVGL